MSQLGFMLVGHSNNTNVTTPRWQDQIAGQNQRDRNIQVIISLVFGLTAFISFCVCLSPLFVDLV